MNEALSNAWQATSTLELVSVVFGLAYVVLAARENAWCWPAALVNTATAIILFWDASLLMESGLNVFYLLIAVYGWWQWQYGGLDKSELQISTWPLKNHIFVLVAIVLLSLASGSILSSNSTAALPYLDSLTTWSAVICTWMVTQKILENWLYWIVIDAASIYLYIDRELYLYALLFALFTVIAVYGYFRWRTAYLAGSHEQTV
ncbi:MAG: nicotinamide riboside transporter PnuC [Pseudomonadales bacterium]